MTDRERELLADMDDNSVEQISEFSEGLDSDAKKRILEKCRTKMNDNKNGVINMKTNQNRNYTDTEAEVKHIKKSGNIRMIISAAACFAVVIGAAAVLSSIRKEENNIHVSPELTSALTNVSSETSYKTSETAPETAQTTVSEVSETSTGTAATGTVTSVYAVSGTAAGTVPVEATEIQPAEITEINQEPEKNYEEEYKKFFAENADKISDGYFMLYGFGIDFSTDEMIWYDPDTDEIYYHGEYDNYHENADFENHPHSISAFPVTDSRFTSNQDFYDFLHEIFTDEFIKQHYAADYKPFIEYDGKIYCKMSNKGFLFDRWDKENFSISDVVSETSFTITSIGHDAGNGDIFEGKISFVKTSAGWRIDNIEYM